MGELMAPSCQPSLNIRLLFWAQFRAKERLCGSAIFKNMQGSKLERAARLRELAGQFRGFAVLTRRHSYRIRMLEMAAEIEREVARLECDSAPKRHARILQ
jgi:hypothetical protein